MAQPHVELPARATQARLVAEDPASRALLQLAERVAAADVTVMLSGESGVGKEVVARYIHERSRRCAGPFVAVNCAAIPETMLEATLFGHEKGAFTGAEEPRRGKFEQADGGTLLLDEVTEMELGLQAKLLRVLQEREVERLGALKSRHVDVRVIATSNRDLRRAVGEGRMREDIYYRLNVFPLKVPALRERAKDIVPLAEHLIARHAQGRAVPVRLSETARARLEAHAWPGNVRELENVVQRALVVAAGACIEALDLQLECSGATGSDWSGATGSFAPSEGLESALRVSEGEMILSALRESGGRRAAAAERLGISPRTLRHKLARLRSMGMAVP